MHQKPNKNISKVFLKNLLLLNTTEFKIPKGPILIIHLSLFIIFTWIIVHYQYNSDWKRWICLFSLMILFKIILDASITITNIITKSNFVIADLATSAYNSSKKHKKASQLMGLLMIVLIVIHIAVYKVYDNYLVKQLSLRGKEIKGQIEKVEYHNSRRNSGYMLYYYYEIENEKFYHRKNLGENDNNVYYLKVKYLPELPNNHSLTFVQNGKSNKADNFINTRKGLINDYEQLFSHEEKSILTKKIKEINKAYNCNIWVVTINSIKPLKKFDDYFIELSKSWLDPNAESDNSIIIAISEKHRQIRIQLGNDLPITINEELTQEIVNYEMTPKFKEGNYYEGLKNALDKF